MKKFLSIALALMMTVCFAACSNNGANENTEQTSAPEVSEAPTASPDAVESTEYDDAAAENALLTGELIPIENDKDDIPELHGISFSGNRCGTDEFNSKEASTKGIRCIFELNEYISATPDTDAEDAIEVYVLQHREDQDSYATAQYGDQMPGFVALYTMEKDEENWGEFYINPDDAEPGYYDFIFTYDGTPFAKMYTRFYAQGELEGKSDDELAALMNAR